MSNNWLDQLQTDFQQAVRTPRKTRQRITIEAAQRLLIEALLQGLSLRSKSADLVVWQTLTVRDYAMHMERFLYQQLCVAGPLFDAPRTTYTARVRLLCANLKRNAPNLVAYEPTFLASATIDQLGVGTAALKERETYLEERRKAMEQTQAERARLLNSDYVGMFRCPNCKSWKTNYYLLQTRSADEPMTAFCQCLLCYTRFKRQ